MSWGTDLWDQYDNIATHTHKGIEFLEKYGSFVDQRCKIEQEYASKLRRLIKAFMPKKKEEEEYETFTSTKAYKNLLNELGDQAGQHELIAENLSTQVVQELASLVKQLKDDRRKHLNEGARIQAQLQSSLTLLSKTKEKYEKAFGASERALDAYQKADADLHLSRAEVEKQRMNSTIKSQQCEEAKNEYANQLQKTNDGQNKYYNQYIPTVYQNLQDLDEKRIKCIQNFVLRSTQTERDILPILSQCLDGIEKGALEIDEKKDTTTVVEKFKSGFTPPGDIPFEDLSVSAETVSVNGSMSSMNHQGISGSLSGGAGIPGSAEKKTILGTITGGRVKKRSGLLGLFANNKNSTNDIVSTKEDFSDLPPNQRRKKLQQKIDDINSKVSQETAARDGLMKMKQVYESNPALGDPQSIQGQLTENGQRLDKLRAELQKYQGYVDEMEGRINTSPANTLTKRKNKTRRNSVSDGAESLSRSASDSSVSNTHHNHNKNHNNALHSHGSSNSPESGICTSNNSLPSSDITDSSGGGGSATSSSIAGGSSLSGGNSAAGSGGGGVTSSANGAVGGATGGGAGGSNGAGPLHNNDDLHHIDDDDEGDFYDSEPLPILGRCKALYLFEVTSEGSIKMAENEELWVIELDQGDGWTRVRRLNIAGDDPMPEGFVPSSYIDVYEMFPVPHAV